MLLNIWHRNLDTSYRTVARFFRLVKTNPETPLVSSIGQILFIYCSLGARGEDQGKAKHSFIPNQQCAHISSLQETCLIELAQGQWLKTLKCFINL